METVAPDAPAPPTRRSKWVIGMSLILLGIGGLAAWAISSPGAVSYYATPSELGTASAGDLVRLGGRVAEGTLERDGTVVRFSVTDGERTIPVEHRGEVPDTLKEATDVIAEGTMTTGGTLDATRVLAKCSSKMVEREEHLGRPA